MDQETGNVHLAAVYEHMAVTNELAGLGAAACQAEPAHDVVEPAFQQREQRFAGVAGGAAGDREQTAELALEHTVIPLELLLLAQADAIRTRLALLPLVHSGRVLAALERTFRRVAPSALQEQFHAFAATESANSVRVACH